VQDVDEAEHDEHLEVARGQVDAAPPFGGAAYATVKMDD
jgi:hypothetical protein